MMYPKRDEIPFKNLYKNMKHYIHSKDLDGDGVPNVKDCAPINSKRQDFSVDTGVAKVEYGDAGQTPSTLKEKWQRWKEERKQKQAIKRQEELEKLKEQREVEKEKAEIRKIKSETQKVKQSHGGGGMGLSFGGYSVGLRPPSGGMGGHSYTGMRTIFNPPAPTSKIRKKKKKKRYKMVKVSY